MLTTRKRERALDLAAEGRSPFGMRREISAVRSMPNDSETQMKHRWFVVGVTAMFLQGGVRLAMVLNEAFSEDGPLEIKSDR